jgi:predicted dehydrogenase
MYHPFRLKVMHEGNVMEKTTSSGATVEKEIGIGVIGSGSWAGHFIAGGQRHPKARVVAVCNPNIESAQRMADRHGVANAIGDVGELLARPDIDAVAIVTPNDSHAAIAIASVAAGKHVICEKPMAMNVEEARSMKTAADEAGVVTSINFTWRHPAAAVYARHLVSQGEVGRIFHINGCFHQGWLINPSVPLIWRVRKEKTGSGCLGDIGAHIVDLAEWVTGEQITSLVADTTTFIDERPLQDGSGNGQVDVDDAASLLVRFGNGAMGSLTSSRYVMTEGMDQRLEIYGDKGVIIMDFNDQQHLRASIGRFAKENQMLSIPVPARFKNTHQDYLQQNVKNFIDAIDSGEPNSPSFADGLHNQEILEAVETSVRDRTWVNIS